MDFIDIEEHLNDLTQTASGCDTVVEFGVRGGGSTEAIIKGQPKRLISFDVVNCKHPRLVKLAEEHGVQWEFHCQDSREAEIPECDFLFIDSEHTYKCLKAELVKHKDKAAIIGFHDTVAFPEINHAIAEECGDWEVLLDKTNNNGFRLIQNPNK